jgi:thiamine biosynthesis lipoprotein
MKRLLTFIALFLLTITIAGCSSLEDEILFDLIQGEEISIDVNQGYMEPGFIVKHDSQDISEFVTVEGTVDSTTMGVYTITYTLNYEGVTIVKTRTVTVGGFNSNCADIEDTDLMACSVVWSGTYLNTVVKLSLYVDKETSLNTDLVFKEVETILAYYTIMADKYTSYDGMMNVYEINQNAGTTVTVDDDLFNLISFTLEEQADLTDFYNMALGPVLQIWHDHRENCYDFDICLLPDSTSLEDANAYTDPSKIILNQENHTLYMEEGMSIDLGGVSKGYVSREIISYLDTLEIEGYLLNNGESNISIGGTHPVRENGKFVIAITNPATPITYYATIYLGDGEQLVTSGDYQKFYTVDGQDYHHIIDPVTLMPLYHSKSVSIITSDPALADLYSTAIFNMTIEDGQDFVNSIDGLEAIWYGTDGTIYFSENFESQYLVDTFE